MTELISQSDIDSLLDALNVEEEGSDIGVSVDPSQEAAFSGRRAKNIKVYDFKIPDKFSKDQLRTLQMIYEKLCQGNIDHTVNLFA